MKMYDQLRTFTSKPAYIIFATELFLHSLKTSNLPKIYPRFAMVFQKLWNSVQIVNLLQLFVVDLYGKWNQL